MNGRIPAVMVIGGTTDGIGKAFVDLVEDDLDLYTMLVPTPQEFDVRWFEGMSNWLHKLNRPVEHVFYAAGTKHLNWVKDLDFAELDETFDVNVYGFLRLVKLLSNWQQAGRICVVSSAAAIVPMRTSVDYCASKAALNMAIKVAAKELPNWHITGIAPGVVDTSMTYKDIIDISKLRGWSQTETAGKLGPMLDKQDVAELAYWLLLRSPDSMSGNVVGLGGGS